MDIEVVKHDGADFETLAHDAVHLVAVELRAKTSDVSWTSIVWLQWVQLHSKFLRTIILTNMIFFGFAPTARKE